MADHPLEERLLRLRALGAEAAAAELKEQLWRDPSDSTAYGALGVALVEAGQLEDALLAFERAHYLQPDDPVVLYHYGLALLADGKAPQARLRFEAALRLDPGCEEARRMLAAGNAPPPRIFAPVQRRLAPDDGVAGDLAPAPDGLPPGWLAAPEMDGDWEPEALPGFSSLARAGVQLWCSQPLIWMGLFAVPFALFALGMPLEPEMQQAAALLWTVPLALGAVPAFAAMTSQWVEGEPFPVEARLTPGEFVRGAALTLPYALFVLGPCCWALAAGGRVPGELILLTALLLTAPFHALFAPALVVCAAEGEPGGRALRLALAAAGRRTWLHLGVVLAAGTVVVGALSLFAWAFVVSLGSAGEPARRVLQVVALSLGGSAWAAVLTICGTDALSAARAREAERAVVS